MTNPWEQTSESPRLGVDELITLVAGRSFCLCDHDGTIRPATSQGLYIGDVRVLSHVELRVDGKPVDRLTVVQPSPDSCTIVARGPVEPGEAHSDLLVVRRRQLTSQLTEEIELRSYAETELRSGVELVVEADFADLFSVKAGKPVEHGRRWHRTGDGLIELSWSAGTAFRQVQVIAGGAKTPDDAPLRHRWTLVLPPRGVARLRWTVVTRVSEPSEARKPARTLPESFACPPYVDDDVQPRVHSQPSRLRRILARSTRDIRALCLRDPALERPVLAAGAPWFMTLFGRDALLTSWMALPLDIELAIGVLEALAVLQGQDVDPHTEEEPGRILHEVRFHRVGATSLLDGDPYYGTLDAPALFVALLGELHRWGVPLELLEHLLPAADRALAWMEDYGDLDGDGLLEYQRRNPDGLVNQAWKDSWDSMRFRDGRIAEAPIAPCEVQGYAYAAYRARAAIAHHQGDEARSAHWERRARELQARFEAAFWLPDQDRYAMALDRDKRPIDGLGSNPGHCLWSGIADPDRAAATARDLLGTELWSAWGVRTLGTDNGGYNPMSYHCGSVWPHDTAIVTAGLARYGYHKEAARLARGLFRAAAANGYQLPELLSGLSSEEIPRPVPYPTACQPQAWSAASPWLLVRTMLGLEPDIPAGQVRVEPHLPSTVRRLRLENVLIGSSRVVIDVEGDDVSVEGLPAGVALVRG